MGVSHHFNFSVREVVVQALTFIMAKPVNFKITLNKKDSNGAKEKVEIRSISVDSDVSTSYTYLAEKLVTVFPALRQRPGRVTWIDGDDKDVTIKPDEELMIALTEMEGPVYKLSVEYIADEKDDIVEAMAAINAGGATDAGNASGDEHPGVTCDACDACDAQGMQRW